MFSSEPLKKIANKLETQNEHICTMHVAKHQYFFAESAPDMKIRIRLQSRQKKGKQDPGPYLGG